MSTARAVHHPDDEQQVRLFDIAHEMNRAGLAARFVADAVRVASAYEGAADLVVLWAEEHDGGERDAIVADLQEMIDEVEERTGTSEKPRIGFDELDEVAKKVVAYKKKLRERVDKWGGVSQLARETGIPQPSLSRFFNTATMPRRTTVYKIAQALQLSDKEIVFDWML
jgi:DNA-binding phage protein